MPRRCPYCLQLLPEIRLGARMSELKARIFDLVLQSGQAGIESDTLFELAYANGASHQETRSKRALSSHIVQINELIEDAGYRIIARRDGGQRYPGRYYMKNLAYRYDPIDDINKSVAEAFRVIKARERAGGPGWRPK